MKTRGRSEESSEGVCICKRKYDECLTETNFEHDFSSVEQEWNEIMNDLSREDGALDTDDV
jgi:hypothetical protein